MRFLKGLLFLTVIVIAGMQLTGCSKMPSAPTADVVRGDDDGIGVDQVATVQSVPYDDYTIIKTWKASKKIKYRRGGWVGKRNKAFIYIPPYSMSSRRNTRISTKVDLTSSGDILCTFAPEGLSFTPSATMAITYKQLNSDKVSLKWWDGSSWVKVSDPDRSSSKFVWNKRSKVVTFDIEHFSIYLITRD